MGNLCGLCFGGNLDDNDLIMANGNLRRSQMAEAAEQRLFVQQKRGIINLESVGRMQQKSAVPYIFERKQTIPISSDAKFRKREIAEAVEQRIDGQQNRRIINAESLSRMQQKSAVPEILEKPQTKAISPDSEFRRREMVEAAERRRQEQQNKGIKNPESVRRMQQKAAELERLEREQAMGGRNGPVLRWMQG